MGSIRKNKTKIDESYNTLFNEVQTKKKEIQRILRKAKKHYAARERMEQELYQMQEHANEQKQSFQDSMKVRKHESF